MQLHHSKHHNTYVTNLNVAEEKLAEAVAKSDVSTAISLQVYTVLLVISENIFFLRGLSSLTEVVISITPFFGR